MSNKNSKTWDFISNYVYPGIMFVVFGSFILSNLFGDSDSSPVDYEGYMEEKADYEYEQMIEDHINDLEIQKEIEEDEARIYETLYYIDNGYYYHNDLTCKGLSGYSIDELNTTCPADLYEHQELSACNWCVKGN